MTPTHREATGFAAGVTLAALESDPHSILAYLRSREPVCFVPALNGWLVTRRDLVVEMMRDFTTFTVDDPRFSTAQVVGPSMLSLDGPDHARHRAPFADAFRLPEVRRAFTDPVEGEARRIVAELAPRGRAELRRELAGPLAVGVIAYALGLVDANPSEVLAWYDDIVAAVTLASAGQEVLGIRPEAVGQLGEHVRATIKEGSSLVAEAAKTLTHDEVVSNVAVLMFGGIETSEGMTANAFMHLLSNADELVAVRAEPDLLANAVEESLRLEPSVGQVDRFATTDVEIEGARISRGDYVILSLAAANRDPDVYPDPDRFDVRRGNARTQVAFAHGPHTCVGRHLARLETRAALSAVIDDLSGIRLSAPASAEGQVFRKPPAVEVAWEVGCCVS